MQSIKDDFGFDQPNDSAPLSCCPLAKTDMLVASVKDSVWRFKAAE